MRVIVPLPRLDIQFSVLGGEERIHGLGKREKHPLFGLMMETGFALVYLHVGFERRFAIDDGDFREKDAFRAGISVMLPRSLWWK